METILIVDDDAGILKFVATALLHCGYDVLEAPDGAAALQLAAQHPGPINLLLTDIRMPGLLGPEVCERLRPQHPETRYLLMSGDANKIELSGLPCLAKPFSVPDLLQSVRQILDAGPRQPADPVRCTREASTSSSRR